MAAPRPQSATSAGEGVVHLGIGKGLRLARGFVKGARSIEDNPVNATLLDATLPIARSAGERALEHFLAAGFKRIEPPILHPASIFLDMSGEAIRGRLFLTADAAGEELCLRPEYTIPVCRAYLASDKAGAVAEYSYLGPVFRAQAEGGGERAQTGLESFGRKDAEAADAEIFSLAMEAAAAAGGKLAARLGDAGLFDALLKALALPDVWRRRLRRGLAQGRDLERHPRRRAARARWPSPACWRRWKAPTTRAPAPWSRICWRSPASTPSADALPARSPTGSSNRRRSGPATRSASNSGQALAAYLAVSGDPDVAADKLRRACGVGETRPRPGARRLRAAQRLHRRPRRRDRGDPLFRRLRARLRLLHRLRVRGPRPGASPMRRPALAGGRYDGLARKLGANADIPAVGAAIALDRLASEGAR